MSKFRQGDPVIISKDDTPIFAAIPQGTEQQIPNDYPNENLDKGTFLGTATGSTSGGLELIFDDRVYGGDYVYVSAEAIEVTTEAVRKKVVDKVYSTSNGKTNTIKINVAPQQSWHKQYGTILVAGGAMLVLLIMVLVVNRPK